MNLVIIPIKKKRGPLPRKTYDCLQYKKNIRPGRCPVLRCRNLSVTGKRNGALCHKHRHYLWRRNHPELNTYHNVKKHAKSRGIPFQLSFPEFMEVCTLGSYDFVNRPGDYGKYPSIDRINPTKGYVVGNIRVITVSENSIKGNRERHQGGW